MSRHSKGQAVHQSDHIAVRRQQWQCELPDVDTVGMAILGRAR